MRRLRWVIPTVLVAIMALLWIDRRYISPRQIGEDGLEGMTKAQIRAKYGAPDVDHGDGWVYYRGMIGGATGITFRDGVAIHFEMRGAR